MFNVREINREDTYDIRHKILRPHQEFDMVKYDTDNNEGSFHVGVFDGEDLICISSFCLEQFDEFDVKHQYRLRAMATLPEYRKMGAGKMAVTYAEEILISKGYDFLWCKARMSAFEYYKKLGFIQYSDVFDYVGIGPHVIMYKKLK